jgi:DNA-binding transcriptional LysR family regulator
MIRDLFRRHGLPPVQLNASGSIATTIRLATNGLGISMLPPIAIQAELAAGTLHLVDTSFAPPKLVYASVYSAPPVNPLAEVIADMARSVAEENTLDRSVGQAQWGFQSNQ